MPDQKANTVKPLLQTFDLTPAAVADLPAKTRNRILNFLARWGGYNELLDTLEAVNRPDLVSMLDLQARALFALERPQQAADIMAQRLVQSASNTAQIAHARYLMHAGQIDRALSIAESLSDSAADAGATWGFWGELHLFQGNLSAAEAAYLRYEKMAPRSRAPQWGLAQVYQQREDLVTANAYAVQAYTVEEGDYPLSVSLLQDLLAFFIEIGDQNRIADAQEQLDQRYTIEHEGVAADVAAASSRSVRAARAKAADKKAGTRTPRVGAQLPRRKAAPPLPDLDQIPVSAAEQEQIEAATKRVFGFDSLRPAQLQIMACALRGEDVLAILPTGAGKSLCYQLPALLDDGVTLVISPLIALMKDQVDKLPETAQKKALAINSSLDGRRLDQAIRDLGRGRYKLIYAAPERLRQPSFIHALNQAGVTRLVIDEAHCVSTWGHDFRPDYLWIRSAHQYLGAPPILAMTATAPPLVRQDIERRLFMETDRSFRLIARDIYRQNLHIAAIQAKDNDNKLMEVVDFCRQLKGPGIVYARSRRQCEEIAAILKRQGLKAEHYHAGISNRSIVQERFMRGESDIIVATIAFGMGVDKGDIRFIVHYGLPKSVEAYYQEAGRAGRDGDDSYCILLHSSSDKAFLTRMVNNEAMTVDFLRDVYGALRRKIPVGQTDTVGFDELARYLGADHTALRVAISSLEQTGMLQRHFDVPKSLTIQRFAAGPPELARMADRLQMPIGAMMTRPFRDVVAAWDGLVHEIEHQLLSWEADGHVEISTTGRDALVSVSEPPKDAADRINALLDRYNTLQKQRVTEIGDFAKTRYCRHGYLANYLGGIARPRCERCDNCMGDSFLPAPTDAAELLAGEEEATRWVLSTLEEFGWGKRNLVRLLVGDEQASERARQSYSFGALENFGEAGLRLVLRRLLKEGLIAEARLSHGGLVYEITGSGEQTLVQLGHPSFPKTSPQPSQMQADPFVEAPPLFDDTFPPEIPPEFDDVW